MYVPVKLTEILHVFFYSLTFSSIILKIIFLCLHISALRKIQLNFMFLFISFDFDVFLKLRAALLKIDPG